MARFKGYVGLAVSIALTVNTAKVISAEPDLRRDATIEFWIGQSFAELL